MTPIFFFLKPLFVLLYVGALVGFFREIAPNLPSQVRPGSGRFYWFWLLNAYAGFAFFFLLTGAVLCAWITGFPSLLPDAP